MFKLFKKETKQKKPVERQRYGVLDFGGMCYTFSTEEEARKAALHFLGDEENFVELYEK